MGARRARGHEPSSVLSPPLPGRLQELVGQMGPEEVISLAALPGEGGSTEAARASPLCGSGPIWAGPGGCLGTQHLPWVCAVAWPEDSCLLGDQRQ